MKKYYHIYKIINLINGKIYIGRHHGTIEDNYSGSGMLLFRAYKKYGKENFKKELIEINKSLKENKEREKFWINELNSFQPNGYNINEGGDGGDNITHHPKYNEIRNKISIGVRKRNAEHPEIMQTIHENNKGSGNGRWKGGISKIKKEKIEKEKAMKKDEDEKFKKFILENWNNRELSFNDIMTILNIQHSRFYRLIKELNLLKRKRKRKSKENIQKISKRMKGENNPRYYELDKDIYEAAKKDYYEKFFYMREIKEKYRISIEKFKSQLKKEGLTLRKKNQRRKE
jgi:hypothetical protein